MLYETNGTFSSFFSSLVEYMIQLFLLKIAPVTLRTVITAKEKGSIKAKCNEIDATIHTICTKIDTKSNEIDSKCTNISTKCN